MLKKLGTMLAMAAVLSVGGDALAEGRKPFTGGRHPARAVAGVININTATAKQLDMLPGVGRHTAALIVAYREKQSFKAPEEIAQVKGLGQGIYRRIKAYLTVSGQTTLAYAAEQKPTDPSKLGAKEAPAILVN